MTSLERNKQREEQFERSLDAAAQSFATPIDPAAPDEWVADCDRALQELRPALEEIRRLHQLEFAEIEREDIGLEPHVQELRGQEGILIEEGRSLADRIAALRQRCERGDEDRNAWETELSQASELALKWISRVREQHLAIRTWLVEAVTRDRGVVD